MIGRRERGKGGKKGEREREVTRRAQTCLRDAQPLSVDYRDQIAHSFVENEDHASRKVKFQLWQLLYKSKTWPWKGSGVSKRSSDVMTWRIVRMKFLPSESSTFISFNVPSYRIRSFVKIVSVRCTVSRNITWNWKVLKFNINIETGKIL